jgi:putative inorganic carbon (HCO3(-)) transporter
MSEALEVIGAIAGAGAASAVLLSSDRRLRAAAMVAALALAGALVLGQAWGNQLSHLRHRPLELAAILLVLPAAIGALAMLFRRHRMLMPLALIAVLPFRIPVDTGSETSYLLIPLYLVIAAAAAAEVAGALSDEGPQARPLAGPSRWLSLALGGALVLYALQTAYSSDISRAVQNVAFFLIPFAVMFALLREVEWSPRLLRIALALVACESVALAGIGIVQHEVRHIFWNPKAMESNEFDLNFRVNSLFWDPNIYARYLALATVLILGALVWVKDRRRFILGALAVAVIFTGMAFAFSQTSYFALLAGAAVLCALRWSLRWTAIASGAAVLAFAAVVVVDSGSTVEVGKGSGNSLDQTTSGRTRLARGGLDLAKARPLQGYGSGSFAVEFAKDNALPQNEAAVSHTEPITVAAEQGALGLIAYIAVLGSAIVLLIAGLRELAPGLGGRAPPDPTMLAARVAVAAAFGALLVHTIGYAGFLTDPLTWGLLAVGAALATRTP